MDGEDAHCATPQWRQALMRSDGKTFREYKQRGAQWITLATGEHYPDVLARACEEYQPVLVRFGEMATGSFSSIDLLKAIMEVKDQRTRTQLCRVFKKYVSPATPVEMLKRKAHTNQVIQDFGMAFRRIADVRTAFASRPIRDEALCAVLWEYRQRGRSGYDLTESFLSQVAAQLPHIEVTGPRRSGKDVGIGAYLPDYPSPKRPIDFVLLDEQQGVLAVGLARYDSDRGGAQEDDRPGQYREAVTEILGYARNCARHLKVVLLNDGPGLLLGTMWDDYAAIEESHAGSVRVMTLRMVPERLTMEWLTSLPAGQE